MKITPQRTTQYAHMAAALALPELQASPFGKVVQLCTPTTLAGQNYILATVEENCLNLPELRDILPRLGATSEVYEYFERIDQVEGPLLRPVEPQFTPFVPLEMAEARRYRGKTNEIFTRVLLNVALFAGAYAGQYRERLRILDPLAGGGTTLFLALAYGYDAFGIELERQDVETTSVFVRQYLENERIAFKEIDERGRKAGRRHQFEIGPKKETRLLVLAHGDARDAALHMREVHGGPRMHAIIGDLPYGIQHFGEIAALLSKALPVWEQMLLPGGTLALSWNATRIERQSMLELFARHTRLQVRDEPPYTQFAHAVDRVIKRRDIIVGMHAS
ncbi:MAG: hypothetical protein J2P37_05065 [Ktedonobacteraceae bacterium]|nr:hypothetical protein [Ktedonobacteraceae bacterium]